MKNALNIIKAVLVWGLVILSVGMMIFTVISVNTFDRNDRSIFGYKAFIVLSDSMSSVNGNTDKGYFKAGDLILVKEVDPATLKVGDIISYTSTNSENYGETVTHMIKEKTVDANGDKGFITYGTSTGAIDANVVLYSFVLGKYQISISGVGTFFTFLKTTPGYIVCIFLPFLLLIIIQGINTIRLFRRYKAEQLCELQAQRDAIEQERKRQEEMMQRLLKMQEELEKDK